jgi:hypothetical protein
MKISREEIQELKRDIEFHGNDCGGCETCTTVFGTKEYTIAPETAYMLILRIELLESLLDEGQKQLAYFHPLAMKIRTELGTNVLDLGTSNLPFPGANNANCDNPNGPCSCGAWHQRNT